MLICDPAVVLCCGGGVGFGIDPRHPASTLDSVGVWASSFSSLYVCFLLVWMR